MSDLVRVHRSVLVGATGRNAGKTEYACDLISRLSRRTTVHAVKVTTIYDTGGSCARGGRGCGVCTSMHCDLLLEEEHPSPGSSRKDTAKLRAAGAARTWWLRVREEALDEAADAVSGLVPDRGVLVIESNAIRRVIIPDLFVMIEDPSGSVKPSARAVLADADLVSPPAGVPPVIMHADRCTAQVPATVVILAGGRSTRMGTDKRNLRLRGIPLVERVYRSLAPFFAEALVSVGTHESVLPGVTHVIDRRPGFGPIGGIASALSASHHDRCFVCACDIPVIPSDLVLAMVRRARNHDIVVPVYEPGTFEPLFAVYNRSVLPRLQKLIDSGERRIRLLYDLVDTYRFRVAEGTIRNLNTREQFLSFAAELAGGELK